jgi:hypothetical protein
MIKQISNIIIGQFRSVNTNDCYDTNSADLKDQNGQPKMIPIISA